MVNLRDRTGRTGGESPRRPRRLSKQVLSLLLGIVTCTVAVGAATPEAAYAAKPPRSSKSAKRTSSKKRTSSNSSRASRNRRTTEVATVKVSAARLRAKPGTKASAKDTLSSGDRAKIVGRKGDWVRVRTTEGREGWIREDLVRAGRGSFQDDSERESRRSSGSRSSSRSYSRAKSRTAPRPVAKKQTPAKTVAKPAPKPAAKPTVTAAAPSARQPFLRGQNLRPATPTAKPVMTASVPKPEPKADVTPEVTTVPVEVTTPALPETPGVIVATETTPKATATAPANVPPAETIPADLTERNSRVVRGAMSYRGTPYRMGATGRGAFDCSAFVRHVYAAEGKYLPRTAAEQYNVGRAVDKADLKPGDLVFFKNTYKRGISHVGIYIGNGQFIHASSGGGAVRVNALSEEYYVNHWAGAKRL